MTDRFALSPRLDTGASQSLKAELLKRIEDGNVVEIDGANVDVIGLACLRVLASASKTSRSEGRPLLISDPSDVLIDGCVLAGLEALVRPS